MISSLTSQVLPDGILLDIFLYLDDQDIHPNVSSVCKQWYCVSYDDKIVKKFANIWCRAILQKQKKSQLHLTYPHVADNAGQVKDVYRKFFDAAS